jgi:hypothetical protein
MRMHNKKKSKKTNLLELSEPEKVILLKKAKEEFKETIIEAKLWHKLLEVENIAVNGNIVYSEKQQLSGLYLKDSM